MLTRHPDDIFEEQFPHYDAWCEQEAHERLCAASEGEDIEDLASHCDLDDVIKAAALLLVAESERAEMVDIIQARSLIVSMARDAARDAAESLGKAIVDKRIQDGEWE